MIKNNSKYIKFIDGALEICKGIPRYFSKFSNRIYCNHQHIILLVLKQKLRTTYEELIEFLKVSCIPEHIGLRRIPHYTTLVKFHKRLKKSIINLLINQRAAKTVAIDGTGFESTTKSYYYRTIWNSDSLQKTRRFVKLSIAIDVDNQQILSYSIHKGPRHDIKDFQYLLKDLDVDYVLADKGYDSKEHRLFIFYNLHAIPNIPYRKNSGITKIGKNRVIPFVEKTYHKRSLVETVFSVVKRKYGSTLLSKNFEAQKKELIWKLIAYNIERKIKQSFILWLRVSY